MVAPIPLIDGLMCNEAFRGLLNAAYTATRELVELSDLRDAAAKKVVQLEGTLRAAREHLLEANTNYTMAEATLADVLGLQDQLRSRLMFPSDLPKEVMVSIVGKLPRQRSRTASVCRRWRSAVETANAMGMFKSPVLCVSVGTDSGCHGASVVCTTNGTFTYGRGSHGRLGHNDVDDVGFPCRVEGLGSMDVVKASAGGCHTVVCTRQGQVFTFGNGGMGRLGHGDLEPDESEVVDSEAEDALQSSEVYGSIMCTVPRLVDGLAGTRVVCVTAGGHHTAVCTDAGQLYTFGRGFYGQLGHGQEQDEWVPRLVQALVGRTVIGVDAGYRHTAICTLVGTVLTCGEVGWGRLGHGTAHGQGDDEYVPRVVEALAGKLVVGVAAGFHHTAAWTVQGELFTWGYRDGLGHGGQEDENTPRLVQGLAGKMVVGAALGEDATTAWTETGKLFAFGSLKGGAREALGFRGIMHVETPQVVQALVGRKVVQVGMDRHILVSTEDGEVYHYGNDGVCMDIGLGSQDHDRLMSTSSTLTARIEFDWGVG